MPTLYRHRESPETLRDEVMPIIKDFLTERGLQLSEEKTVITHISDGFDFLGQNVRKYNGKLLIKPSKNAIKSFLKKVRTIVRENKTATQDLLIRQVKSCHSWLGQLPPLCRFGGYFWIG